MEVLYAADAIAEQVQRLGREINRDYQDSTEPVVVMIVLQGALLFAADLLRQLTVPCVVQCVRASSYRESTSPGALTVQWLGEPPQQREVLVIEDIVDTGQTLAALCQRLQAQDCRVRLCTLLDKPQRRRVPVIIDYRGFVVTGNPFVVGYGLDYQERYRELPYIGVLDG